MKVSLSAEGPIFFYWDEQLLPAIDGQKETLEQIAIIISRNRIENFLMY